MILTAVSLKVLRKLHEIFFGPYEWPVMPRENDADKASYAISDLLVSDKPCMIARFGSTELACLTIFSVPFGLATVTSWSSLEML